ncbi:Integrator complex subunit-like protein [Dorcoceras hygrometricum]|uniref:Integrator complex subunit-like protein n=1 Tax=Dorcoceras hygrometricum TaxID=472368 RepID=A0A2Z7CU17_9LAMI|nr:Integrator complex subunit-like protein [Dorcoceras hygrometricum]
MIHFQKSLMLSQLSSMATISAIADKEDKLPRWANIDYFLTTLERRSLVHAKYRELLIRKFFTARIQNFVPDTPPLVSVLWFSRCLLRPTRLQY